MMKEFQTICMIIGSIPNNAGSLLVRYSVEWLCIFSEGEQALEKIG